MKFLVFPKPMGMCFVKCDIVINVFIDTINEKKNCGTNVKSTQYKKLAPNALQFTNLKSFKSHEKNETKNIRPLIFSFSKLYLAF